MKDRIVQQETLSNGLWVSTVRLPEDCDGRPFETSVFRSADELTALYAEWSLSLDTATEVHERVVRILMKNENADNYWKLLSAGE